MQIFASAAGIIGLNPSKVGGTGTSIKIFPSLIPPTFGAASVNPASLSVAGNGALEGKAFTVRASGNLFVHGAYPTVNFTLQSGTSLTASSNVTVATLASAQSLTTAATYPFSFKADLQGDSASGIVQVVSAVISCNGVSGTVTATDLTGVSFLGPNAALNLVFGVTFGVSDGLNAASLMQFSAEA